MQLMPMPIVHSTPVKNARVRMGKPTLAMRPAGVVSQRAHKAWGGEGGWAG